MAESVKDDPRLAGTPGEAGDKLKQKLQDQVERNRVPGPQ